MKAAKARRLKAAGWKVGSTKEFLRLNDQEAALVEVKLCLMDALRQARRKRSISQVVDFTIFRFSRKFFFQIAYH